MEKKPKTVPKQRGGFCWPLPFFSPTFHLPFALQLQIPFGLIYLPLHLEEDNIGCFSFKSGEVEFAHYLTFICSPSQQTGWPGRSGRSERRDAENEGQELVIS